MADPLDKIQVGQRLPGYPTDFHNATVDMLRQWRQNQANRGAGVEPPRNANPGLVLVKNTSGSAVARFGVLGISGILIARADSADEFDNNPCLTGVTPAAASHKGKFVVLREPLANNAIGWATIAGLTQVQIVFADAAHKWCDITDAAAGTLTSAAYGSARILYSAATSGTAWGLVNLGQIGAIVGMRWNNTSKVIEITYDGSTWTTAVTFGPCPTPS
jgi:hypothetical protein